MLLSAQAVTRSVVNGSPQSARSEHSQECAFDAARSTPAGAAGHRSGLDGAFARRRCRLSQRQAYRWLARYRAGGAAALADRSSAPQRCPTQVPAARVAEIERLRRQRLSGPAIARQLGMPVSTVGGILRRLRARQAGGARAQAAGGALPARAAGRADPHRHQEARAHRGVGHRITGDRRDTKRGAGWEAVHVCIDDASRLAYSEVLADERKTSAVPFLERAVGWFARQGVTVERVMTDNGSAYRSHHWRQACGGPGCATSAPGPTRRAPTARPSASSRPACASGPTRAPLRPRTNAPPRSCPWLDHYNSARPHAALAHQPPASRLCPPAFLGSTDGAVPPSRPASTHDRPAGTAPGAPQATGASRRAASLRRPAGPVTLEQEEAQCSFT